MVKRLFIPEEDAEGAGHKDQRHQPGSPQETAGEDRRPRVARRTAHDIGLGGLEGEGEPSLHADKAQTALRE